MPLGHGKEPVGKLHSPHELYQSYLAEGTTTRSAPLESLKCSLQRSNLGSGSRESFPPVRTYLWMLGFSIWNSIEMALNFTVFEACPMRTPQGQSGNMVWASQGAKRESEMTRDTEGLLLSYWHSYHPSVSFAFFPSRIHFITYIHFNYIQIHRG